MTNLKLSNNFFLFILSFIFLSILEAHCVEPADIWNIDQKKIIEAEKKKEKNKRTLPNTVYEMQSEKKDDLEIVEDETLLSKKIEIAGIYDPSENGLKIDMWSNSDGKRILDLLERHGQ